MDQKSVEDEELLHLKDEIAKLHKKRRDLITRKYYLQCQCYVPRPLRFKEYERIVAVPSISDVTNVTKLRMDLKLKMYLLCGIKFSDNENNLRVEISVACGPVYLEGFYVEIGKAKGQFTVVSFYVPSAISMYEIMQDVSLKTFSDIPVFLWYLHRCMSAFFHRREQVYELQTFFKTRGWNIDIFSSHHKLLVELQISSGLLINSESDTNITFVLKYEKDSFVPISVSYLSSSDQLTLDGYMKYFSKRHLKEAFMEIMYLKNVKSESVSEPQSFQNESKQNRSFQQPNSIPSSSPKQLSGTNIDEASLSISTITTTEKGASQVPKKSARRPIASSTPCNASKKSHNTRMVQARILLPQRQKSKLDMGAASNKQ